jgi:rare lipoprotein A
VWLAITPACGGRRARAVQPSIGSTEVGIASWYGNPYHGRRAANGEIYDMEKFTAAHREFAFDTWVRVHNLHNGKSVDVRITDRGPFVDGRIIDLSRAAARAIDMIGAGLAKVRLVVIDHPTVDSGAGSMTAKTSVPAEKRFAVQAGAFRDHALAEKRRAWIEKLYGPARLIRREGATPLWRVLVGDFAHIEDAESLAQRIRKAGDASFVVPLDDGEPASGSTVSSDPPRVDRDSPIIPK